MSLLRRALERRGAPPGSEFGSSAIPPNSAAWSTGDYSTPTSIDSALQIITALSCVGILADGVSTLPIDVYEGERGSPDRRKVKQTPDLIEQPFAEISRQDWLGQEMTSLSLRGNAWGYVAERDRDAYPTQVMPLPPDQCTVKRDKSSGRRVYTVGGTEVPAHDIVHIPALTLAGSLTGINPIASARISFALSRAAEGYGNAFFTNSAHASGVVSVEGDLKPEETIAMARSFMAAHQGVGKAHLPAVLTGGATWTPISVAPDDAQFLQTRGFQRSEIAMLFRVPPHMLGDVDKTTSWGTGIEQQEQGFVTWTLSPWLYRLESALSAMLPGKVHVEFNLDGRLRGDTLTRYQGYVLGINNGFLCQDEARGKEGLAPLPGNQGQTFHTPLNLGTSTDDPLMKPGGLKGQPTPPKENQ